MKQYIQRILILVLPLLISWSSEAKGKLDGSWTLVCYHDLSTGNKEKRAVDQKPSVSLNLKDNGQLGTIHGHTISNKVYGNYELWGENNLTITKFGGTKVGELDKWGGRFWNAIQNASSYEFKNSQLIIYYDHNSKALIFENY